MQIGAQFYTIRDFCKTTDGLAESLKKVADIGYKTVQISGTCEYDANWLANELKKNGLKCVLTHTSLDKMKADPIKVCRDHTAFGCDYVGLGWFGFDSNYTSVEKFINEVTPAVKSINQNGKYFMYHNHAKEFTKFGGKTILEIIAEAFLPNELGFTLDTYWVQTAGGDPAYWLEHLKGRVPCIHLKDHDADRRMAVIGEGNINFDRVFQKAEAAGTKYMLVEQDNCNGEDPFNCLKRSYEFLKSRGFE